MKLLTNLLFIAATVAVIGSSASLADDPQLQNRLAAQCAQNSSQTSNSSSVALYANQNGISGAASQDERSDVRFQIRPNAHGQVAGVYDSVR